MNLLNNRISSTVNNCERRDLHLFSSWWTNDRLADEIFKLKNSHWLRRMCCIITFTHPLLEYSAKQVTNETQGWSPM